MSIELSIFLIAFAALFFLNVPIVFVLLIPSTIYLAMIGMDIVTVAQQLIAGMNNFTLLAIPLFILAADLMNNSSMTRRLFTFANSLVGRIPGGMGHTNVLASVLFAGMSGSSAADAAGLGLMEIEAMDEEGFDRPFSVAVTAASSTIGPIIPPSIPLVLYGSIASVSVGRLFMGGILPGVIMAIGMMIICFVRAKQRNYPRSTIYSIKEFLITLKNSLIGLVVPIIILGGIYTGKFTPTEAAGIAAVYAFIVGMFVLKELKFEKLKGILINTAINTTIVVIIMGAAALFGWVLTIEQIPLKLASTFLEIDAGPMLTLLILNILFIILGCFMEINSIMLIFLPMILPILRSLDINLVHFGVVMVFNLMIGTLTPPFGMMLYVTAGVGKVPVSDAIRELIPFYIVLIIILLIITYIPNIVLFLPNMMFV